MSLYITQRGGKKGSGLIGSLTKKETILHQNQDLKPKKKLKLKV